MNDTPCVVCTRRPPRDGWTVCDGCAGRLDDNLARIAELTRLAAAWLDPRSGTGGGVRSVPASRPPIAIGALDASVGNDALPLLESWERLVRDFLGYGPYGPASAARNLSDPRTRMISKRPGDAGTSRGMDTASKER